MVRVYVGCRRRMLVWTGHLRISMQRGLWSDARKRGAMVARTVATRFKNAKLTPGP